jgi:hypothetical protein
VEYYYRIKFGLTEQEMREESWDSFRTNLAIMQYIAEKEHLESMKKGD